ncbi:hypothetical protein [Catenovulum adriaticum]|uniref:DNA-binding transcriptional repressor CapW winged helix-turn-helix domain-containing protein n=1 Tax=Catenovulum adriaticum TaxID=2984846 RepID=A0ABY7ANX1_9ALTE|nr:hypothetical protein [Catenovulum sp. TS8]WAJ71255.1 hypothetical protein OLW01_05505 [Catenovulum sp. TS8]
MKYQKEFTFIEACAKWRGKINATDIASQFLLSKGSAKRVLQAYQTQHLNQFILVAN